MDSGLSMFRIKDPLEVSVDYCDVNCLYNTRNCILLNAKLRDIERRYRTELCAYNVFRPIRYLSLEEQV